MYDTLVALAPTNVKAKQIGLTSINVTWSPSDSANGYTISYTSGVGSSGESVNITGGSISNYTLKGLEEQATYTISILATSLHFLNDPVERMVTLGKNQTNLQLWRAYLPLSFSPSPRGANSQHRRCRDDSGLHHPLLD